MNSAMSKIEQRIQSFGKGSIFFPDDFVDLGTPEAIRQALTRLAKEGIIVRVAQGIYCNPEVDDELGLGVIMPTYDQVAEAMAKRDSARIVPTGAYAQNVLGLSTQVPMNYVYMTDGSSRHVDVVDGTGITFKHTAPKNLSFKSRLAMLITFALKSLKKENVSPEHIEQIKTLLRNEPKEIIFDDLRLMPVWVRNIVVSAYE